MKLNELLESENGTLDNVLRNIKQSSTSSVDIKAKLFAKILFMLFEDEHNEVQDDYKIVLKTLQRFDYLIDSVIIKSLEYWPSGYEEDYLEWLVSVEQANTVFGFTISDNVKLAAVKSAGSNIEYVTNPTSEMVSIALTDPLFIHWKSGYERFVKNHFKSNSLLQNKWLRYGENVRGTYETK